MATRTGQGFDGMVVGSPRRRPGGGGGIRAPLAPVGWALLAAALVWIAWWFAVRTEDPPAEVHSIGIAARVLGGGTQAGRNLPASRSCPACAGRGRPDALQPR